MTTFDIAGRLPGSQRPQLGFLSFIRSKWREYRLMRTIESVPYDVMKDVGYPGAERTDEM